MNWLAEVWRRLVFLLHRSKMDADLAEEMRLHLDLRAAERRENGAEARDAEAQAQRRFGNATLLREKGRDIWGWRWLESIAQDLRYSIRTLAANPGFALTAVLSLALGIGANTAIFSIVNAVMLRSLPVEDPHRLVELQGSGSGFGSFTNPLWEQVRDHQQAFAGALAFSSDRFDLADGGESRFVDGMWVSGDFFRVLGVAPLRGRVLTTEDDRHGGGKYGTVAVISHSFWQSHFGADPAVVGKTVRLNRHAFEIVGVTPPWFTGLEVDRGFQVAIPIGCEPILHTDQSALEHRSWWWLRILGRLAPGMRIEEAEARMKSLAPEIYRATVPQHWDERGRKEYLRRTLSLHPAATGFSDTGSQYRKALLTLMAVVGLVLLIACANVANLLLARGAARQREISVRMAIGAGRRRVIRQLLTESLMLSLCGAAGGLLLARWGSRVLIGLISSAANPLELDVSPDARVLGFTIGLAVLTAILFGLAPAFRATSVAPNQFLKENARGSIGGSSRFRLGKALVAGQVALSLVLLVAAGLFLGTMRNLLTADTGFNPRNVLLVRADTRGAFPKAQHNDICASIVDRLRRIPGVASAAGAAIAPVSHRIWNGSVHPEGYQAKSEEDTLTNFNGVSPGYFRALEIPLLVGRDFGAADTLRSPKVMIIGERTARQFFGSSSPLGKKIGLDAIGKPGVLDSYEVIGVVRDTKYEELREDWVRTAYLAAAQDPDPFPAVIFFVRSSAPRETLTAAVRSAIGEENRRITLEFGNFENEVNETLLRERLVALLSAFFGGLALLLSMIGLYGVTSYAVLRRQGEIGIRMALGAQSASVLWLVLRDVILMLAAGTVLGLAAALAAGRLVSSLLYGVRAADPATLGAAVLLLGITTVIAGYVPARRASRLDPTAALREE